MGDNFSNVDTSKFRLATWNYIHLIYGIYHDDYVYYEVLLNDIFFRYASQIHTDCGYILFPVYKCVVFPFFRLVVLFSRNVD